MEQSKSILGFILETATQRSFSTFSCALYLFFMFVRAEKAFSHKYASLVNQSGSVRWSASWNQCSIRNMRTSSRSSYRRLGTFPRKSKSDIEWTCFYVVEHFYRNVNNMFKLWFKCFACKRFSVNNTVCGIYVWRPLVRLWLSVLPFPPASLQPCPYTHTPIQFS